MKLIPVKMPLILAIEAVNKDIKSERKFTDKHGHK